MSATAERRWTKSPGVMDALRRRRAHEVCMIECDLCGSVTYYNEGSHCTCEHCGVSLDHLVADEEVFIFTVADAVDWVQEGKGV